jgi:hypothetical protein
MNKQKGFINIPGWIFLLAPIGTVLIVVELIRLAYWLYENVEIVIR